MQTGAPPSPPHINTLRVDPSPSKTRSPIGVAPPRAIRIVTPSRISGVGSGMTAIETMSSGATPRSAAACSDHEVATGRTEDVPARLVSRGTTNAAARRDGENGEDGHDPADRDARTNRHAGSMPGPVRLRPGLAAVRPARVMRPPAEGAIGP